MLHAKHILNGTLLHALVSVMQRVENQLLAQYSQSSIPASQYAIVSVEICHQKVLLAQIRQLGTMIQLFVLVLVLSKRMMSHLQTPHVGRINFSTTKNASVSAQVLLHQESIAGLAFGT